MAAKWVAMRALRLTAVAMWHRLFNEWPGSGFTSSSLDHVYAFSHILVERGVHVSVRHSKGACFLACLHAEPGGR